MKRWHKVLLGIGVFLLLAAGFTGFILPGIVKSQAIKRVETATDRKLAIKRVGINPFTWVVTVEGARFTERDGKNTFASFSSVRVAVSPTSIFRGAPIVSSARISAPYLHIVRTGANTYNFSDLMEGKEPKKPAPEGKRPRFSLNNITIVNGSIDFIDRGLPVEKRHEIRGIRVGVPFVSTIPYYADRYIDPHFGAVINGAPLALEGKLKPFARAAEYSVDVDLKDLSIPYYLAYVPAKLPVRVDAGQLTTRLEAVYRTSQDKKPELTVTGAVSLAGIKVAEPSGTPLAALQRLDVKIAPASLLEGHVSLSALNVDGPELFLSRDSKGELNIGHLMEKKPPAAEAAAPAPGKQPFTLHVGETKLRKGMVHVVDSVPSGSFRADVKDITVDLRKFSTQPGKQAEYELSFATGRNEKGSLKGTFVLDPLAVTSVVALNGIVLEGYYPYLTSAVNGPIKGSLDLTGEVAFRDKIVTADKIAFQLRNLAAVFNQQDGIKFTSVVAEGGRYSQKDNLLEMGSIAINGGDLRFSRDREGTLSPVTLLKKQAEGKKEKPAKRAEGTPFRYRMKKFSLKEFAVNFTDRQAPDEPTFSVKRVMVDLNNLTWPERTSMPFSMMFAYGKGGTVKVKGSARPEPLNLKGEVSLQRIPITDFDAYLPENITITLADGKADARLSFALAKGATGLTGSYSGDIGVRSFYAIDEEGDDLLKWDSLDLEKIRGQLAPFALEIGEVALNKYFAKVVVEKDRTLNLQHIVDRKTPPAAPTPGSTPAAATSPPPPAPAASGTAPPKTVKISTITFQEGTMNFTDRHLPREFSTTFYNLGGRVSGLTSEESKFADVDLRGNLENLSPLQITGTINPLRSDLFVDLTIHFKDIDLTPLTPYSGTYLGYTVDKGKLNLDLKYHIEKKNLVSENKVFIDQFTFGDKVESDKATSLPVRLAIALLKDRNGEIHLDLPVTGRTDDPHFSVWRVVLQIFKNLLVKAATSPFSLIQMAFGGKEDFNSVSFAFGSDEISQPEREKLVKLASALNDRPVLKVTVTGFVDRERDAEGYRNELLLKKMKSEKFRDLIKDKKNRPEDSPETVQIAADEYSKYLKVVYRKEKFPKPRTIIGLAKDLPDAEMKKLILTNTVVGDEQLHGLAKERAAAVKSFLVERGKVDGARIFQKSGDIYKAPAKEGERGSRVEFGAAVD